MQATAEIQVVPVGAGVSVRQQIEKVVALLQARNFRHETHASGTNIEGELDQILAAIEAIHDMLHREGIVRLLTYIKIETRTDKAPTLAGKRLQS